MKKKGAYNNLAAELSRSGAKHYEAREIIGVSASAFSRKINGALPKGFTVDEAIAIRDKLFPKVDIGYLFKRD